MKVAVLGTGRVGLPLSLAFVEAGADVTGIEINEEIRKTVLEDRKMPFLEPGFEDVLESGKFKMQESIDSSLEVEFYVVTVGTPLLHHIETDLSAVTKVVTEIAGHMKPGQTLIMRSTTAPQTTEYVKKILEKNTGYTVGKEIFLACCPERILEGKAREELLSLPQIVGTMDDGSAERAQKLFDLLGTEVLHCDYTTAELVKLFNNVSRYAYFALANVLAMIAVDYGAEPYKILELTNHKYPRPITSKPGFTAGTCLRKDFGMLSEAYWSTDILISSWRINETMPKFLVDTAKKKWGDLSQFNIGILGYSFKKDADDVRDTLSDKLLRYVHRECPAQVIIQDHLVKEEEVNLLQDMKFSHDFKNTVENSDLLFIATNHSLYTDQKDIILKKVAKQSCKVVDLWNCLETGNVLVD